MVEGYLSCATSPEIMSTAVLDTDFDIVGLVVFEVDFLSGGDEGAVIWVDMVHPKLIRVVDGEGVPGEDFFKAWGEEGLIGIDVDFPDADL